MSSFSNEVKAPRGVIAAGKPEVNYLSYRPTPVTKKNVRGIPGMDLDLKATVSSPRTSRAIRRATNGAFGHEKVLKSENYL